MFPNVSLHATQLNFLTGILQQGTASSEDAKLNRLALEMQYGSPQAKMEQAKAEDFLREREAELDSPAGVRDIVGPNANEFTMVRMADKINCTVTRIFRNENFFPCLFVLTPFSTFKGEKDEMYKAG